MSAGNHTETRTWMLEHWARHFSESLSGMTGEPADVRATPDAGTPQGLFWAQEISGVAGPSLWVAAPDASWQAIGNRVLEQAGLSGSAVEEQRGTFLEVLTQANSAWCRDAGQSLGRELTLGAGDARSELPPAVQWLGVTVRIHRSTPERLVSKAQEPMTSAEARLGKSPSTQMANITFLILTVSFYQVVKTA